MPGTELWIPPRARAAGVADHRKATPPKLGEAFGQWAGRDISYVQLPGGGVLQFDLNKLTLSDYRSMRDHYQINASLSVLQFMMHQLDWRIEGGNAKSRSFVEDNLRKMWTRLIRALSQAYWAGYSPIALQYENNVQDGTIEITKFKDLVPEECRVHWKKVDGWAPPNRVKPKFNLFDGISQHGTHDPIPVENSLWYPLLMENGDHYGKKLLRPAFPSWFFSILIHLFANRYYERFGEPVPVARADFDATVEIDGRTVGGREAMENVVSALRNRAVVVLPSDRDPETKEFDYTLEYLESQMRGADFERYMTRLDEEMSIGLFTPILLLRTADVGSYNLGTAHMQMYLWMLNALADDLKEYIDRYIVNRLKEFNFGPNHPDLFWVPRKMGKENVETIRAMVTELLRKDKLMPDIEHLAAIAGVDMKEIEPPPPPEPVIVDPGDGTQPPDKRIGRPDKPPAPKRAATAANPKETGKKISSRIADQIRKAFRAGRFTDLPKMGFHRAFVESLEAAGHEDAVFKADALYADMDAWLADVSRLDLAVFGNATNLIGMFDRLLMAEIEALCEAE